MKKCIILLSLILLSSAIYSQSEISGIILSSEQIPIEFASVSVFPLSDSTAVTGEITANNGTFTINNLKNQSYVLTVQMLGYEDYFQQIDVFDNLQIGPIKLAIQSNTLEEIQIVAQQSIVESHLGKKVLRIGLDLSSTGSNALQAIDNIPSITTTPKGQIKIRGNSNVVIYINGKETRRDPATLKFIAAESLDKIEVITNPSAKYDAEGVGGIINIVYKRDAYSSVKLEVISNMGILTNPFYLNPNGGINASISKKRMSFFTNISADYGKYTDYIGSQRTNFNEIESLQYYESARVHDGVGRVGNALIGFSFEADSSSSIGIEINYDRWDLRDNIEQTNIFDYRDIPDNEITIPTTRSELENELWLNLAYSKSFKKERELKISLTAGGEDELNFSNSEEVDLSEQPSIEQIFLKSSNEKEMQRYYNINADYEAPFFNIGTIEAGLKADLINYNILQVLKLRSNNIDIPDNDFSMDMQKLGVYLIQRKQIQKIKYAIGIRFEQFSSEAFQQSDQRNFTQKYKRLFPSAQFNYMINGQEHTIGLNYTRRINRPSFFNINPYLSYEDPLNLSTGNPSLSPEIADLFELNYNREWKSINFDLTLYQRNTTDAIQSIASLIDENRTLSSTVNIGEERNRGVEAQLDYRPFKFIKTSNQFVLSQRKYDDQQNEITYNQQTTWGLRFKQQFQFKNDWKVELTEIFMAPSFEIQEKRHEQFYMHFSLSKKNKNKRGNISVSIRDIFNTRDYVNSLRTSDFELVQSDKWQTRSINLGLMYLIIDKRK